jgi:hypothetical protein
MDLKIKLIPATKKQQDYIAILLNDLGYGTIAARNGYIETTINKKIKTLDQLTIQEASIIINRAQGDKGSNED